MSTAIDTTLAKGLNGSQAVIVEGRDSLGRFVKGGKGGPGNPHIKRCHVLRKAIYEAITITDVQEVIRSMLVAAKAGDVNAAKLVLNYVVAQPNYLDGNEDDSTISVVARIPRSQAIDIMSTSSNVE